MARQLRDRPWGWITVAGLVAFFIGSWYWHDSRSDVVLHPQGKATFYRGGLFQRDTFELSNYGGTWQFFRKEPHESGELAVPFECDYNKYYYLRLEEGGRAYIVDKEKMDRSELSVPVKKNISSAGLVDSGPVGGEAVQNSTVVSICGDFLAARSEPPLDCVQDEL